MPDDQRNMLFCAFPHGLFPVSLAISAGIADVIFPEWGEKAGERIMGAVASVFFKVPLLSPLLTWLGCHPASPEYVRSLVRHGSCVLLPDGIAGVFHSNRHREVVFINQRKGFIKLALQQGATLVPGYCFGHTQLHDVSAGPDSIWMTWSRKLRISLVLFAGRFGLPVPHRFPIVLAIGKAIPLAKVENPSVEEVDAVHALFVEQLVGLFNRRKHLVGWEDKELFIV